MLQIKHSATSLAVVAVLVLGFTSRLFAQVTITVDENGAGILDNSAIGVFPLAGVLAPDPGPGGLPAVLTYDLLGPPALVAGDVLLQEGVGGLILDVVRFNPAGSGGNPAYPASLVFYSDNTDGIDALADTLSPPGAFYANTVTIQEIGPEGNNGAFFTPTAVDPGFVPGFAVTYHFISDGILPEPGSIALIAFGGIMLGRRRIA